MRYFIITLFATFLFSSCTDTSTNPDSNKQIIPLEIGNQWIYRVDIYDSLGVGIIETRYDTTKVTEVNDGWYSILNLSKFSPTAKFQNRKDGFYVFNQVVWDTFIGLFFQFPTKKDNLYNVIASTMVIRGTKTQVETEQGNFDCIEYYNSPTNKGLNYDYFLFYLAPDVGIVKVEYYKFKYPDKHILQDRTLLINKNF